MNDKTRKLLFDVLDSGRSITEWCSARTLSDYESDRQPPTRLLMVSRLFCNNTILATGCLQLAMQTCLTSGRRRNIVRVSTPCRISLRASGGVLFLGAGADPKLQRAEGR